MSDENKLIEACKAADLNLIKKHIDNGADINIKDNEDNTALIIACEKNHEEIALFIISKGANVSAQNKFSYTPLMWATLNKFCIFTIC